MPPVLTHETEPREVDTVVVPDLDRTLLVTDELAYAMCDMLIFHGVEEDTINNLKAHIDAHYGQSFPVTDYLIGEYGAEILEEVKNDLLQLSESDELRGRLLHKGAVMLLDALDSEDIPHAILTHGVYENQKFKVELFRRLVDRTKAELPAEITEEKYKGEWIHKNWCKDGRIMVPTGFYGAQAIIARQVIVMDDKEDNLFSPDPGVKGIWIDNSPIPEAGRYQLAAVADLLQQQGKLDALASHHERKAA